jgi:hypothetical protein
MESIHKKTGVRKYRAATLSATPTFEDLRKPIGQLGIVLKKHES